MVTKAHRGMMHVPRGKRRLPRRRGRFGRGSFDRGRLTRQEREQRDKIRDAQLLQLKNRFTNMSPEERLKFRNTSFVPKEIQQSVAEGRMPGSIRQAVKIEPRKPRRPTIDPRRQRRTHGDPAPTRRFPKEEQQVAQARRFPKEEQQVARRLSTKLANKGGLMKSTHNDMRKGGLFK